MIGLAERSQSEVRVLDPPIVGPTRRRWIRRRVEIRVLQQDLFFESAQFGRRDDAKVLVEQVSSALESPQRVRLASASVEGHHVERPEFLAVGVFPCQSIEVGHDVAVLAGGESGVHHFLDRGQAEFRQPRHLPLECLTATDVVERCTSPQCERFADRRPQHPRDRSVTASSRCDPTFEVQDVAGVGVDTDLVAGALASDHRSERLAKLRHVRLHGVSGCFRRVVTPQPVDQAVDRHDSVRFGEEHREHETLLGPSERRWQRALSRCAGADGSHDPGRTEHLEAHDAMVCPPTDAGRRPTPSVSPKLRHAAEHIEAAIGERSEASASPLATAHFGAPTPSERISDG